MLDDAHYAAAVRFGVDLDAEADWAGCWTAYLEGYVDHCGVTADRREEVHLHLDSEFADAALWYREAPGCRDRPRRRSPRPACGSASCRTPTA